MSKVPRLPATHLLRTVFPYLRLLPVLALLLSVVSSPSSALPVDGLYSFELTVQNQSDAERRRAYREALAGVMLKVTGETRWLQQPQLQSALNNAQSFVEEVSFRSGVQPRLVDTEPDADVLAEQQIESVQAIFINVRFSRAAIDDLLDSANIPIWDRNRPSVLVWLSIQNASGERMLLGSDSEHQVMEIIRDFSQRRGIPLLIPVLDFTDRRNLSADQAWSLEQQAIMEASERYGADSVLSGRLLVTPTGDLVGLWQFMFDESTSTFDGFDSDLKSYMETSLDQVTTRLAARFSIVRNTLQGNDFVILRVDGIKDIASHQSVVSYVRDLAVVKNVAVSRLNGHTLELKIALSGSRRHLAEFINLDRDLEAVNIAAGDDNIEFLHYRWTR